MELKMELLEQILNMAERTSDLGVVCKYLLNLERTQKLVGTMAFALQENGKELTSLNDTIRRQESRIEKLETFIQEKYNDEGNKRPNQDKRKPAKRN